MKVISGNVSLVTSSLLMANLTLPIVSPPGDCGKNSRGLRRNRRLHSRLACCQRCASSSLGVSVAVLMSKLHRRRLGRGRSMGQTYCLCVVMRVDHYIDY